MDRTWGAIYMNLVPCLVVALLNLIPEACHQDPKKKVMVMTLVIAMTIGIALLSCAQLELGFALCVGTGVTAL